MGISDLQIVYGRGPLVHERVGTLTRCGASHAVCAWKTESVTCATCNSLRIDAAMTNVKVPSSDDARTVGM